MKQQIGFELPSSFGIVLTSFSPHLQLCYGGIFGVLVCIHYAVLKVVVRRVSIPLS